MIRTHHNGSQSFDTLDSYWECSCTTNYIHPKSLAVCPRCKDLAKESPNALLNNVLPLIDTGDKFWIVLKPVDDNLEPHGIYDSVERACEQVELEVNREYSRRIKKIRQQGGKAVVDSNQISTDGWVINLNIEIKGKQSSELEYWVMGYNKNLFFNHPLWEVAKEI